MHHELKNDENVAAAAAVHSPASDEHNQLRVSRALKEPACDRVNKKTHRRSVKSSILGKAFGKERKTRAASKWKCDTVTDTQR